MANEWKKSTKTRWSGKLDRSIPPIALSIRHLFGSVPVTVTEPEQLIESQWKMATANLHMHSS